MYAKNNVETSITKTVVFRFFFSFIFISWGLITSQYCSGFCHTEQNFGLCGRRRGWDVSREQHRNMYII